MADRFPGIRLLSQHSAVTADAVRSRRTIFVNRVLPGSVSPALRQFEPLALLAAPLVVFDEVIGAVTFLHDSDEDFFNEDLAAKATILAGQLSSLLEAARLREASREEHRRAEILTEVAHALHGTPDVSAVIESLADRLRLLLRTRLVSVLLRREGPFELRAVSAETPQLANSFRAAHDRQTIRFAADLAQRAVSAGEVITVSISSDQHSLAHLISPVWLIAAPFRTARTQGAILVYPRKESAFTAEEKSLVSAISSFGAVAVAHAEMYATAQGQAQELHQLLEISSELSSSGDLDQFLQAFVVRGADFLGFGRCFIALRENQQFHVRYGVDHGAARRVDNIFPEGIKIWRLSRAAAKGSFLVRRSFASRGSKSAGDRAIQCPPDIDGSFIRRTGGRTRHVWGARPPRSHWNLAAGYSPSPRPCRSGFGRPRIG